MPEQLSNSNQTHAHATPARRSTRAASLPVAAVAVAFAAWCGAPGIALAQNAAQPRTAPASAQEQAARPGQTKATAAQDKQKQKPAPRSASEITRARRAAAPNATPSVAPAATSSAAPAATPSGASTATPSGKSTATSSGRSTATPSAAPKTVSPAASSTAAPPVDMPAAAPGSDGAKSAKTSKSKGEEGEVERLRAEIRDARPGAERARLQRTLVEHLVALKRQPEALDALRLMIHEDRYDPAFFFNTGNALARLGDASAAEDAYRKAILQRRGNYSRALNNLGVILIRQGHWDEAQETLAAALLQENYAYPDASYNLGRLHLLRGEANLAIREWQRTLRLEPAHAEAAAALARVYAEDGEAGRGLDVLDNFVSRSTRTGAGVPREIAEARRELVAAAAEDGAATNPETGDADAGRVAAPGAKSRVHKADRATYDLLRAARTERESGSDEEAVKHYRGVLARSPGGYFPPANLELGGALISLKRDEEAIAALLPVTEKDAARYPVAHYHLGRLFERQGHLARAADSFARASELYGDANPQVLIDLSRVRESAGDHAGALAAMDGYAAALERQGTVPAWVAARQAKLRQKAAASPVSPAPNSSTPTRQ